MKRTSKNRLLMEINEKSPLLSSFKRSRIDASKSIPKTEKSIHQKTSQSANLTNFKKYTLVIITLIILISSFIYQAFKIKSIKYDGKNIQVNNEFIGKSLIFLDEKQHEKNLSLKYPNFKIKVSKIFPDKIRISALENEGFVLLITPEGKKAILNKDGIVLSIFTNETDLKLNDKLIKIDTQTRGLLSQINTNQSISNHQILQIINVLSNLGDKILLIKLVNMNSNTDVEIHFGDYDWMLTLKKDSNPQLHSFLLIYDELTNTGKQFLIIDTRFNQPVVKY